MRLQRALGQLIPHPERFTLGWLRSGGATHLFQRWHEDVPRLRWRGRWRVVTTLAHYIQELTAVSISTDWPAGVREVIEWASELCIPSLDDLALEAEEDEGSVLRSQLDAWSAAALLAADLSSRVG